MPKKIELSPSQCRRSGVSDPDRPASGLTEMPVLAGAVPSLENLLPRPHLTVQEVADFLGSCTNHVRALVDCGVLRAGHIGMSDKPRRTHLRITRESVVAFHRERFGGPSQ